MVRVDIERAEWILTHSVQSLHIAGQYCYGVRF